MYNPTRITTYIDGVKVNGFDKILDFSTDENGETQIYIPIRDFATYLNAVNTDFGYQTFKGDYNPKTEDENKCYVYRDKYEVAMYTKKSKIIYKAFLMEKAFDLRQNFVRNVYFLRQIWYYDIVFIENLYVESVLGSDDST